MKLTPLGVGDAFSGRYYSACMLLEHDGCRLLIDCPHPLRKMLVEAELGLDLPDIDAVVLTHLHADHCSGLESFGFFNHFVRGGPLPLLTHPRVSARVWERLAPGMDALVPHAGAPTVPHELRHYWAVQHLNTETAVQFGPFSIEARLTTHHIPTTALRIRAGGASLGYSADTSFDPSLITWLDQAELIVHETNRGVHTPLEDLEGVDERIKAKMHLIHYPDDLDVERCSMRCLQQGRTLEWG